jgi:hypothetical protein
MFSTNDDKLAGSGIISRFQRVQAHMRIAGKENAAETYESLKNDYLSIKAVLTS